MSNYYVFSKHDAHVGYMDKCILWWRESGHGYTYDLKSAGVFTEDDKAKGYPPPSGCVYVPVEVAEAAAVKLLLVWWSSGGYPSLERMLNDVAVKEVK